MADFDIAIIGGGPGGITAGIYAARKNLKTALFERKAIGGNIVGTVRIENYPGFDRISGIDLAERMESQLRQNKVEVIAGEVTGLELNGEEKRIMAGEREYTSKAVILAMGSTHRMMGIPGEKEYFGKGVFFCATCDAPLMKGKKVAVIGGGNSGLEAAIYLADMCEKVYLVHRRDTLRADEALQDEIPGHKNIELVLDSEPFEVKGNMLADKLLVRNTRTQAIRDLAVSGIFVQIGELPNTEMVAGSGIELDGRKRIKINCHQETNIGGVYAIGDVTDAYWQIVIAAGHGATAALRAYDHIKHKR